MRHVLRTGGLTDDAHTRRLVGPSPTSGAHVVNVAEGEIAEVFSDWSGDEVARADDRLGSLSARSQAGKTGAKVRWGHKKRVNARANTAAKPEPKQRQSKAIRVATPIDGPR